MARVIADSGLMSRRAAEDLISQGRVSVDGRRARIGERIDPERSAVTVDGKPIPARPGLVTYLLFKPRGVVSTVSDPQGRPTVVDLVPTRPRVYPVGRLDYDSEGLILLTNDGTLANLVAHPRHGIKKRYSVLVEGKPGPWVARLERGVTLTDGRAAASSARVVDTRGDRTLLEIVMGEGKKREIRRMCTALGHEVVRLVRTGIGPLSDRSLRPGRWRRLQPAEVAALYAAARFDDAGGER